MWLRSRESIGLWGTVPQRDWNENGRPKFERNDKLTVFRGLYIEDLKEILSHGKSVLSRQGGEERAVKLGRAGW